MSQRAALSCLLLTLFATAPLRGQVPDASRGATLQRQQTFDLDPLWDGQNNHVLVKPNPVVQDFGYSATQFVPGGGPGEIGGRVQRSSTPAFYGKRLETPKSFESKLHCSGTLAVVQNRGTSCLYFGWFNTQTPGPRPLNWMGICLNGEERPWGKGCEVQVGYCTAHGQSDGIGRVTGVGPRGAKVRDFNLIPSDGTPYTFEFDYDPAANDGNGEMTFTLGGKGPYTGGPFRFKFPAMNRQTGATFDAFGITISQSAGNWLTAYFDDISIDGEPQSFDADPGWIGQGNRASLDDYALEGAHQFGFSQTSHAGGNPGELGGVLYSSDKTPGYYGDRVGRLTLDQHLVASGKVTLKRYGPDGGSYLGWFDSRRRGHPPANVLGVLIDGPTSSGPRFRGCVSSSDPTIGHWRPGEIARGDTAALIPSDGRTHTWSVEYLPEADGGLGRMTVRLDDHEDTFTLLEGVRAKGAEFDRFGMFVQEVGGRASEVYFDDVEYTVAADEFRPLEGHGSSVMSLAFSPDGKTLASSSRDKTIKFWNVQSLELERTLAEHTADVYSVAYSPRGDLLASGSGDTTVRLWDPLSGKTLRTLTGHTAIVRAASFSPDQKTLASGGVDLTIRLWDVATGQLQQTWTGHTQRVMSVVFSPDGSRVASGSSDGTALLWDAKSGHVSRRFEGHNGGIESVEFSPDGKLLATSCQDGTVRLWDVETGDARHALTGHVGEVDSVTFSPDGTMVASGCKDKLIKLWDVQSGELRRTLRGHVGRVESLAFSPDGRILASGGGGGDNFIRLWKINDASEQ